MQKIINLPNKKKDFQLPEYAIKHETLKYKRYKGSELETTNVVYF